MQIAEKVGKTPAQVVLRWGLQRGTSVLPKSTNFDRLRSNLEVTEWSLSEEDMKALSSIDDQVSLCLCFPVVSIVFAMLAVVQRSYVLLVLWAECVHRCRQ